MREQFIYMDNNGRPHRTNSWFKEVKKGKQPNHRKVILPDALRKRILARSSVADCSYRKE